jgi:hypothetical protein
MCADPTIFRRNGAAITARRQRSPRDEPPKVPVLEGRLFQTDDLAACRPAPTVYSLGETTGSIPDCDGQFQANDSSLPQTAELSGGGLKQPSGPMHRLTASGRGCVRTPSRSIAGARQTSKRTCALRCATSTGFVVAACGSGVFDLLDDVEGSDCHQLHRFHRFCYSEQLDDPLQVIGEHK